MLDNTKLLAEHDATLAMDVAQAVFFKCLAIVSQQPKRFAGSLSSYAALALLANSLSKAGRIDSTLLREQVKRALVFRQDVLGLHYGAAGLLAVLHCIDPENSSFSKPRRSLTAAIRSFISSARPDLDETTSYELVGGVSGLALVIAIAENVMPTAFLNFAEDLALQIEDVLSGYATSRPINLGVSHGIAGVLAALNHAGASGVPVAERYARLLIKMSHFSGRAHRWHSQWNAHAERPPNARPSWCYQTGGIAAVLYDHALISGNDGYRSIATSSLREILDCFDTYKAGMDAALCHGRSGMAAIFWKLRCEDECFSAKAQRLCCEILAEYDVTGQVGYRLISASGKREYESPDFLDGAIGIATFLMSAAASDSWQWLALLGLLPDSSAAAYLRKFDITR